MADVINQTMKLKRADGKIVDAIFYDNSDINTIDILDIKTLKQVDFSKFDVKLLCNEETSKSGDLVNLKRELKKVKENMKIAVVIGPEGGVDKDEISYLEDKGFISVSLGKRILRTETVVFSILSMIGYELELKQ